MRNRWTTVAVVMTAVSGGAYLSTERAQTQSACLVTTVNGDVQGVANGSSCTFLGIPFAAPPVGALRWRPPQPAVPWAPATLNAVTNSPICPQISPAGSTTTQGNENCLRLNIWTPNLAPSSPAPVIVWIPTGAFQSASANLADSNGRKLAERTGAIVVAAHYRLGPFGFLGHSSLSAEDPAYRSSGNYGFLDQRAALVWVRDHIAAFGGDPNNVTIAGQSAGANSVSLHLVSPGSAGLFTRAIMQSGYASNRWATLADAEALGHSFAASAGCTDPAQVLTCMRGRTQAEVLLAFANGQQQFAETPRVDWGPVVDGLDIPDQPRTLYEIGAFAYVPVVIGATRDEGWIYVDRSFPGGLTEAQYVDAIETEFGVLDAPSILARYPVADFPTPKHALSQIAGDVELICEARRVARLVERTGTPVYMYSFEREVGPVAGDQVIHGLDRNFVFGNNFGSPSNYVLDAEDLALFDAISGYWTRLAATGNPNTADSFRWPRFKHPRGRGRGADRHVVLDWPLREGQRLREDQCDFWEPFFLRSIADGPVPAGAPSSDLCGVTVTENLELDHDLVCPGDGLIVGVDGLELNLNGHTLTGTGIGAGISVTGRSHVAIFGGTVENFAAGVRIAESTDVTVKWNTFAENTDGVDLQSGSRWSTIKENAFSSNRSRGIMLRGNTLDNAIRANSFTGNRVGVLLFGAVDTTVKENIVSGSVLAGIRINVLASGNLVKGNWIAANPAGIEFLVTPTGSATGNSIVRNTITTNTCGIKGPVAGNAFRKNVLTGNVADSCQ